MKTWAEINDLLAKPIPKEFIKPPDTAKGIFGDWLKGSTVVEFANQVFGSDGWSSELMGDVTKEDRVVARQQDGKERHALIVTVPVRIVAYGLATDNGPVHSVYKDDVGWGVALESWGQKGVQPITQQAIRAAIQGAVTIGIKRCMHQFGRFLGNELYVGDDEMYEVLGRIIEQGDDTPAPAVVPDSTKPVPTKSEPVAQPQPQKPAPTKQANTDLAALQSEMEQLGTQPVALPKVKEQLGDGASVADVWAKMPDYVLWMVEQVLANQKEGKKPSQAGANLFRYEQLVRRTSDLEYEVSGGDWEPWDGVGVHNPTSHVGVAIEQAMMKNSAMIQGMLYRFPDENSDQPNRYHLRNHLKAHYDGVEKIALLTWEQLSEFRHYLLDRDAKPPQAKEPEPEEVPDYRGMVLSLASDLDEAVSAKDGEKKRAKMPSDILAVKSLTDKRTYEAVQSIVTAVKGGGLSNTDAIMMLVEATASSLPPAAEDEAPF